MEQYGTSKSPKQGPYHPSLILHGGAGAITPANLPPALYNQYRHSLLTYLRSTRELLDSGASALTAACDAVSLMEDDELFNCGRGSVFTLKGEVEMEASVMVSSLAGDGSQGFEGSIKRAAAVSLVGETRHPILLAREVLLDTEGKGPAGMHVHLSGREVEEWGWEKGLERKGTEWFWTRRRWEEHKRGLATQSDCEGGSEMDEGREKALGGEQDDEDVDYTALPSQGTVGAVCMDSRGNLAVATSTGGLTNKKPGRIGDTPTVGAGFWAESWNEEEKVRETDSMSVGNFEWLRTGITDFVADCLPISRSITEGYMSLDQNLDTKEQFSPSQGLTTHPSIPGAFSSRPRQSRRAVAMSGTGNGDSFLRTNACRTAAAMCRFSKPFNSLSSAITDVSGPDGELQRSAGNRWKKTGEGEGGIIGIEMVDDGSCDPGSAKKRATVVYDLNCGGLWRAYYDLDSKSGIEHEKVMVFRDEYKS